METGIIVCAGVLFLVVMVIQITLKHERTKKDLAHQRALVSVLRHRLGDKQDTSIKYTLDELKDINKWSQNAINDINNYLNELRIRRN